MVMRNLDRAEIEAIWTIDRSEVHHHIYRLRDGELVLTPGYFDLRGWPPDQVEQYTPLLYACFDRGGAFIGMFDETRLVGVAVVDTLPIGADRDHLQLKFLYTSFGYRRQGIGTQLFEEAKTIAGKRGSKFIYVSATPTENTINFYFRRGCVLAQEPDAELFALEPEDIHLICAV